MDKKIPNYQNLLAAIEDGSIESDSPETLRQYLFILCKNTQQVSKPEDVIMGITINHVSMKQHIDTLDKQNSKTQKLVMALAIASLFVAGTQIYYARKADIRSDQIPSTHSTQRQMLEIRLDIPWSSKPPVFYQPKQKKKAEFSLKAPPKNKINIHTKSNIDNAVKPDKQTAKFSKAKKSHEAARNP